ncbi:surface-adhesin E family protein [Flavobacterium johnsoniae]|uniref:surface-adhesin E family protein n=1 Tax=Flavobacterium johnsoniae TaxID=986 RepID=UPI0011EE0C15|nr:surface-adhesin E family protein [Flavobacterium johnsoniae]
MKKIFFLALFIMICNKSFSQSDEFQYVTSAKDGTEIYLYFEKGNDDIKEFWLKIINPTKTVKNKKGQLIKTGGDSSVQFYKLDCSEKRYSTSDGVIYDRSGKVIQKIYTDSYDDKIIPGTVMSSVYRYVCEN